MSSFTVHCCNNKTPLTADTIWNINMWTSEMVIILHEDRNVYGCWRGCKWSRTWLNTTVKTLLHPTVFTPPGKQFCVVCWCIRAHKDDIHMEIKLNSQQKVRSHVNRPHLASRSWSKASVCSWKSVRGWKRNGFTQQTHKPTFTRRRFYADPAGCHGISFNKKETHIFLKVCLTAE